MRGDQGLPGHPPERADRGAQFVSSVRAGTERGDDHRVPGMGEQVGRRAQPAVGYQFLAVIMAGVHALTSVIHHGAYVTAVIKELLPGLMVKRTRV